MYCAVPENIHTRKAIGNSKGECVCEGWGEWGSKAKRFERKYETRPEYPEEWPLMGGGGGLN